MSLFHYTGALGAQSIIASGRLRPGESGRIWFSTDDYSQGSDAMARLSIERKALEFKLDLDQVEYALDLSGAESQGTTPSDGLTAYLSDPAPARTLYYPDSGVLKRPGGGAEVATKIRGVVLVFEESLIGQWRTLDLP